MTKVVYLDATKSLKVNPKDTFGVLTVLSSSGAVNVNGLSGDYEVSDDEKLNNLFFFHIFRFTQPASML